jgi:DNA polymerase (family X)
LENKAIANIFYETADLMEVNGDDSFRIRSYRRAAEALEGHHEQVCGLAGEPKRLLEIPGIGKGMAGNIQELCREGKLGLHQELLQKYRPSMLELLKIQGLGPKTIALIWSAFQVSDLAGVPAGRSRPHGGEVDRAPEAHQGHREDYAGGIVAAWSRDGWRP